MDLFTYLDRHVYIGFCFMIIVLPAMAWPITILVNKFFILLSRVLRTINITTQGWPPDHLDADGDAYITDESEDEDSDDESEKKG